MAKYVGFRQGKVHESHVISEYYCGGCGYPVTDHDSFCPECGGAFRECDANDEKIHRLEAENAKLREQVTRLQSDWESERDYADQMEAKEKMAVAENDKLRQLAKAAWILFLKHGAVGPYELPEVDRVRESLNELEIKVSWEELGIEVEDDD